MSEIKCDYSCQYFLFACESLPKTTIVTESSIEEMSDLDGDGYFSDEDCDDSSILVHPNAEENL